MEIILKSIYDRLYEKTLGDLALILGIVNIVIYSQCLFKFVSVKCLVRHNKKQTRASES